MESLASYWQVKENPVPPQLGWVQKARCVHLSRRKTPERFAFLWQLRALDCPLVYTVTFLSRKFNPFIQVCWICCFSELQPKFNDSSDNAFAIFIFTKSNLYCLVPNVILKKPCRKLQKFYIPTALRENVNFMCWTMYRSLSLFLCLLVFACDNTASGRWNIKGAEESFL